MEGPPLGPGGEDITWPDQVAPRGRKASSTRKIKPQTSNLIIEYYVPTCLTVVRDLPTSTRGTAGFGSTGLHEISLVDYPDSLVEAPSIRVPDTPPSTPAPSLPLIELLPYVYHTLLYIH